MGVSGRYDFKGIKKYGAKGLIMAVSTIPYMSWVALPWASAFFDLGFQALANWLANKGLIILNITAIPIEGEWDQKRFDDAINAGLKEVEMAGPLTPAKMKEIDDKVIAAFRKFGNLNG